MPLIKINRKELLNITKKINPAPKSDKEGHSRAVTLLVQGNNLSVFSKNMRYRFRGVMELADNSEKIEEPFTFEMLPFFKFLSKLPDDEITLHYTGSKVQVKILSGVINFENYKRMAHKLIDDEFWNGRKLEFGEGSSRHLINLINTCQKTNSMALTPEYKKCCVKDNNAYMWYGNIIIRISGVNLPNFGFRFSDIPALKKTVKDSDRFSVFTAIRDYQITTDTDFSISYPYMKFESIADACTNVIEDSVLQFEVPFDVFKEVLGITSFVCGQFDTIQMLSKYSTEDNNHYIMIESSTKTGRSLSYPLIKNYSGGDVSLKFNVGFIKQLVELFNTLRDDIFDDKVIISVDSKRRAYFKYSNVSVVIGNLNK